MSADDPKKAELQQIAPGVVRVTAPNPGPMTGPGTNSYIVGDGPCVVIDPGVDDSTHLARLRGAVRGELTAILLTHRHPDHAGGADRLARETSVPIRALAKTALGEYDTPVEVTQPLTDGETLTLGQQTLTAIHAPGHAADHLCFFMPGTGLLFAGDAVMADVTVVILPPDGVMSDYLATLDRLAALDIRLIAPGHGHLLDAPAEVLAAIRTHRLEREAQVRAALPDQAAASSRSIAAALYPDLDERLRPMATAQVEAHLIRLAELGYAQRETDGGWTA